MTANTMLKKFELSKDMFAGLKVSECVADGHHLEITTRRTSYTNSIYTHNDATSYHNEHTLQIKNIKSRVVMHLSFHEVNLRNVKKLAFEELKNILEA